MAQSLVRVLPGEVPELLDLVSHYPDRYPGLLSSEGGASEEAVDVLFALPTGGIASVQGNPERVTGWGTGARFANPKRFTDSLDDWWRAERTAIDSRLPFAGGWCVFLSYEFAAEVEPSLDLTYDPAQPLAVALRCPAAIVVIRGAQTRAYAVVEEAHASAMSTLTRDYKRAQERQWSVPAAPRASLEPGNADVFQAAVAHAKTAIEAGEVYQANLSRQWRGAYSRQNACALYAALRESNPAPFSALVRLPEMDVVSSSPERLVRVQGNLVSTRPIAGTRPRGTTPAADAALIQELTSHPKELAEHVMLIDLERNDLGRICVPGSVEVDEYMTVESYAHVHHIVSNVRGVLRTDVTPGEVLSALFPGGTITGCPKVRCMELISQLEQRTRGAYTGSLGYLNRSGDMDLNILIRTLTLIEQEVRCSAGAGIVADSDPTHELLETNAKALGMLRAVGMQETTA
ncbi:MAG: aminodeoxychorismate synthase component I [Pseudomonadota bacterium]